MITKPMLAGKCESMESVKFPTMATPKLDGIRCLKISGKAVSRKFLPVPNTFAREWIESNLPDGVDGELIVDGATFSGTSSGVGNSEGEPDFRFYVFDYVKEALSRSYVERMSDLLSLPSHPRLIKLIPVTIHTVQELVDYEIYCAEQGWEGVMIRDAQGIYKCGRSTEKEGLLLKIKRWQDAEAEVLECLEGNHNANEALKDAFGRTKRSTAKAGKIPNGTLGGFRVKDLETGVVFKVSGGDMKTCKAIWDNRESAIGRIVRYKFQPVGVKDAPRFPQFTGFREPWDIGDVTV